MSHVPPDDSQEATGQSADAKPQGRLSRWFAPAARGIAWIVGSRFRMAMALCAAVATLNGILLAWFVLTRPEPTVPRVTGEMALEALDRDDFAAAKDLVRRLAAQGTPADEPNGIAQYVLAAATAAEAAKAPGPQKKTLYLLSARHLREACAQGLPDDRMVDALRLLGKSLLLAGQPAASQRVLEEALKAARESTWEIHGLLAAACMEEPEPEWSKALEHNTKCLADPRLSAAQRSRALLQRAEILLRLGQHTECIKTLGQLPAAERQGPEAIVLRAEMALREAQAIRRDQAIADRDLKAREKYEAAMQLLRRAQDPQNPATATSPARCKAAYLLGVCLMETGDPRGALHEFFLARSMDGDGPEVLGANLCEAELSRQAGKADESLAAYSRALAAAGEPQQYHNPFVPLEQLRRSAMEAYRQYLDARDYRWCAALVQRLSPAIPLDQTLRLAAETDRLWARDLLAQAERLPAAKAAPLDKQARVLLCRAGLALERSARLHFADRSYTDDLWQSATAYLEGRDYRAAAATFRQYLAQEVRRRNPQGWTSLGEALLALDRTDEALAALTNCIDFYPRDAASFRARLLAARACADKQDAAQAQRLLRENLDGELLTPTSVEWRDSLFALGELLHRAGRFDEAVRRLDEAVRRYPNSSAALDAQYLLADAHRQLAKAESAKLDQDASETLRTARAGRVRGSLQAALDGFRQTEDLLVRAQTAGEPSPRERTLLRNCRFQIGSLLLDLGQCQAAIKTYTQIINRSPDAPESLDAYLQIARAYRQLDNQAEARAMLKQAQATLAQMKAEVAFQETTNRSRQEWEAALFESK